jgi:hypothetical protein
MDERVLPRFALRVVALAGSAVLVVGGCTPGGTPTSLTTSSNPGNQPTATTVAPAGQEQAVSGRSWEGDPRDPGPADWDRPRARDAALMAIALHPAEVGLTGLEASQPVPWNVSGAPGFLSDVMPLEAQIEYLTGVDQLFRATYEDETLSDDVSVSFFETIVAVSPSHREATILLDEMTAEIDGSLDMFEAPAVTRSEASFTLTATEDAGAVSMRFGVFDRLMLGVLVAGPNGDDVTEAASSAWPIIEERMRAVVEGNAPYGPLPSMFDHVDTAKWTTSETLGGFEGQLDLDGNVSCSLSGAVELSFSIDEDRVHAAHLPDPGAISTGGAPVLSLCGSGSPGRPAPFSTVESRQPDAFLRWLPNLSSMSSLEEERNGIPSIRIDLTEAYGTYLASLTSRVSVADMKLWLSRDSGWVVAWEARVTGDADDLERNGFNSGGASSFAASFDVTAVNSDIPRVLLAGEVPTPPSGTMVAFTSDRVGGTLDVFLTRSNGSVLQLTDHPNGDELPAISPDGSTVVFTSRRSGNESLYLIDSDGTDLRRLTAPISDGGDSWAQWSPDGTEIVFASDRDSFGNDNLWIIGADGAGLRQLLDLEHSAIWPSWSPDGTTIAFVSTTDADSQAFEIYVVGADGSNLRRVTNGVDERDYGRPQWFADSKRLLATIETSDGNGTIVVIDIQTGQQLFSTPGSLGTVVPNTETILYTNSLGDIESLDLTTLDRHPITLHVSIDLAPSVASPQQQ